MPLPEQDRTRWDHEAIASATRILEAVLSAAKPGPFQMEAAISAARCRASSATTTDWDEIAALYAALETYRPTPAVRVNRAFAVGRSQGPEASRMCAGIRMSTSYAARSHWRISTRDMAPSARR